MNVPGYKIILLFGMVAISGMFIKLVFFKHESIPESHIATDKKFTQQLESERSKKNEEKDRPVRATQGDLDAQVKLCLAEKIDQQSLMWCRYLADKGNEQATIRFNLAKGKYSTSIKKLIEADANHGDVDSQYELGFDYYLGLDEFTRDIEKFYFWISLALKNTPNDYFRRSYTGERPMLGRDYFVFWRDIATEALTKEQKSTVESHVMEWKPSAPLSAISPDDPMLLAAKAGNVEAELKIANLYQSACCGKRDYAEAYFWQRVAKLTYFDEAPRGPETHLSPEQRAAVELRVKEWQAAHTAPKK